MKSGLILVNAYATTATRQVERLAEELEKLGVKITAMRNNGMRAAVVDGKMSVDHAADFCIYLDKDKYIARMLEKIGMRLFNRAKAIEDCDDKMLTHIALSNSGIPMPKTLPGLLCYDNAAEVQSSALDKVENALAYPIVAKLSYGSMGKGVYLARNRSELNAIANELKPFPHLFQKYIASSHGKDMRVIVVGDNVIGGMIREASDGDFRSNVGLGGRATKTDVPKDIRQTAVKIANILGLDYCGIDFLLGEVPLVCEVNSNAFFDAFENATGLNVAAAYAEYIVKEIYG